MAKPYSADLRERARLACEAGARPVQVAAQFRVGLSTVYLWRKQAREDGRRAAKPHAGGPAPKVTAEGHDVIRALVEEDSHATLAEYVERFARRTGQTISQPGVDVRTPPAAGPAAQKRRSGPRSRRGPISRPSARPIRSGSRGSIRTSWCSSTRPGSRPG
jgi:transposase